MIFTRAKKCFKKITELIRKSLVFIHYRFSHTHSYAGGCDFLTGSHLLISSSLMRFSLGFSVLLKDTNMLTAGKGWNQLPLQSLVDGSATFVLCQRKLLNGVANVRLLVPKEQHDISFLCVTLTLLQAESLHCG